MMQIAILSNVVLPSQLAESTSNLSGMTLCLPIADPDVLSTKVSSSWSAAADSWWLTASLWLGKEVSISSLGNTSLIALLPGLSSFETEFEQFIL